MRNLLNPKWLLVVNTLPVLLLIFLGYAEYSIISTLLKPENKELWTIFAATLGFLWAIHLAYSIYLIKNKKEITLYYAFTALIVFILYLYFYMWNAYDLIPWDVPDWMQSGNLLIYGGTFLMPTLAFCLFIIVVKLTPETAGRNAARSFLTAIAVPVLFFLFYHLAGGLWRITGTDLGIHFVVIFIITGTTVFLYFLIKTIYIIASRKDKLLEKYKLAWLIPITILLPLLGLLINNGFSFFNTEIRGAGGIFGDFSNLWYYILAIINGVLLCLPDKDNKIYRLTLFIGRCVTFSFTFYFFLVFLPFLPLSVIAIIAIGTGFLMLVPLLLFVIHVRQLDRDIKYLASTGIKAKSILITAVLVIPAIITIINIYHKNVLDEALQYVYEPDYIEEYDIDTASLAHTLNTVKDNKENRSLSITQVRTPYLSSYYNWIVLDNMTLSEKKIQTLEKIYLGSSEIQLWDQEDIEHSHVNLTGISHHSNYNNAKKQWESTVDLVITNESDAAFSEYATKLDLPDGCWISDYYLYVGDRKEKGILAEKKAATWIYSQIRNENRDPGILYYTGHNRVAFRVFPFAGNEVRKTGISFIHKEPVTLTIDGNKIVLGNKDTGESIKTNDYAYIPASEKAKLQKVSRKPYLHFIIDASAGKEVKKKNFQAAIDYVLENNAQGYGKPKFTFAGTYASAAVTKEELNKGWDAQKFAGGFYAERAIKKILLDSYHHQSESYPVMVLVTDSVNNAIIEKDFSDLKMAFPDNERFYVANALGKLTAHTLIGKPKEIIEEPDGLIVGQPVLAWPSAGKPKKFIRNDSLPEIVLLNEHYTADDNTIKERDWNAALSMQAEHMSIILHPEKSADEWLRQVRHSFKSQVMSPHTSYIVVENEAQKAVLRKKQEQVLSGNKSLDLGEDEQRMSEPGLLLLLIFVLMAHTLKKKYTSYRSGLPSSKIKG